MTSEFSTAPELRPRLTVEEVGHLLETHFPQLNAAGKLIFVEHLGPGTATLRMKGGDHITRPGGTASGPSMFLLADLGVYVALLGERGEAALQAVTANMNINFLSRPEPRDLIAQVRLLKVGRRMAVGEVDLFTDGHTDLVAHATATYSLPREAKR